jgi:NAD(P)-dependent dehydrogenase (short-subunit alcohol dehydrogenase family)
VDETSGIKEGRVFRPIHKVGKIWGDGMTPGVRWEVVKDAARGWVSRSSPRTILVAHADGSGSGLLGVPVAPPGGAVFLASAASDYVSGMVLTVDGGWMGR